MVLSGMDWEVMHLCGREWEDGRCGGVLNLDGLRARERRGPPSHSSIAVSRIISKMQS